MLNITQQGKHTNQTPMTRWCHKVTHKANVMLFLKQNNCIQIQEQYNSIFNFYMTLLMFFIMFVMF